MSQGQQWVLASGNAGKLAEMTALFEPLGVQLLPQSDWNLTDAVEDGLGFVENALIKARHASRLTGLPALADDSGLAVDALGGAPGIHSARYAGRHGDDAANNSKLLEALVGIDQRQAAFHCAMVLVRHAEDPVPLLAMGSWPGSIRHSPAGSGGFGYDPLFQPRGMDCSSAELPAREKNRLSHRARAAQQLLAQAREQWFQPA